MKSPVLLDAALAILSTIVAIVLAEGVTRILGLAPAVARIVVDDADSPLQVSNNPVQGYELKSSFSSPAEPGFRTNSRGLRGPERAIPKPPGTLRVALVGDSVVEGIGVGREEDTIAHRLEKRLEGQGVEVINAGVRGYNTQAEVELLRRRVLAYEPDLVMVVFVRNDHQRLNRHTGVPWDYRRPRSAEWLFAHSHLFRRVAFHLNWFHFRDDLDPDYLQERIGEAQASDNVAAGLDDLARLSEDHGFDAILVVWPNFADTIKDPGGLMEPGSNGIMRVERLAARHDIPVLRLSAAFTRDYARRGRGQPTPRRLYTSDGMHPSAEGSRVAAIIFERLIRERGLLSR